MGQNNKWKRAEDRIIANLRGHNVDSWTDDRWNNYAIALPGRTGASCKRRWLDHIRHSFQEFTDTQDRILLSEMPNGTLPKDFDWSAFAVERLGHGGPTGDQCRFRWNNTLRFKRRRDEIRSDPTKMEQQREQWKQASNAHYARTVLQASDDEDDDDDTVDDEEYESDEYECDEERLAKVQEHHGHVNTFLAHIAKTHDEQNKAIEEQNKAIAEQHKRHAEQNRTHKDQHKMNERGAKLLEQSSAMLMKAKTPRKTPRKKNKSARKDKTTPAAASRPPPKRYTRPKPMQYENGQTVFFTCNDGSCSQATISAVGLDKKMAPSYTILVDGREVQTDGDHLSLVPGTRRAEEPREGFVFFEGPTPLIKYDGQVRPFAEVSEHLFIEFEGRVYRFEDVAGDGQCLYSSLSSLGPEGFTTPQFLQALLKDLGTLSTRNALGFWRAISGFKGAKDVTPKEMDAFIEQLWARLSRKVPVGGESTDGWGTVDDCVLYSFLSNRPVTVVTDRRDGFEGEHTQKYVNDVCRMGEKHGMVVNAKPIPDGTETSVVLCHEAMRPVGYFEAPGSGVNQKWNHYGKLIPVLNEEEYRHSPIYLGGGKWRNLPGHP